MAYEPKPGMVSKVVDWIANSPKRSFIISLIIIIGFLPGLSMFGEKYDVRIWFRTTDPLIKTLDAFEKRFGNDESLVIAIHSPNGVFDMATSKVIHEMTDKMWRIPQVIRVDSLANYNYSYAEGDDIIVEPFFPDTAEEITQDFLDEKKPQAMNHKVMPGYLISKDGRSVMLFARLAPTLGGSPNYETIITSAREIVKSFEGTDDHEFHIIGEAAVNDAFREIANGDGAIILPTLFALIVFYLIFVFRSVVAMLLPLTVTLITVLTTLGFTFYIGFKFNNILSILPAILISISIADSVHILVTYFQFLGKGMERTKAAYYSLHKNFIPTLLTSLSTMIGFFSLMMTELIPIKQLGLLSGVGCFIAWLVSIFFMGPLLFWLKFKAPKHFQKDEKDGATAFSHAVVEKVDTYKVPILIIFSAMAIGAGYLGSKVNVNSNPYEYFAEDLPIYKANEFIKKSFGGNAGPEMIIDAGAEDGIKDPKFLKKVETLKNWIDDQPYVNKTIDIVDIIKDMNKNLYGGKEENYVLPNTQKAIAEQLFLFSMSLPQGMDLNNRMSLKNDAMRLSVLWSVHDTRGWLKHIDEFKEKAKELDLNVKFTGKFYLFQRMMDYVVFTFLRSVTMAMFLVALLMMLLFRSVKIGLLSLIPNTMPLIMGGAIMYFGNIDLNIGSAIVASVCLGIAVDDTIHFLSNYYRLKAEGVEEKNIIANIYTYTGSALTVTTVILASGFGLYIFGDFVPNVNFGLLCALILTGALIVDLIFLPAMLLKIEEIKKNK